METINEELPGRRICMCCGKDSGPAGTEGNSHGLCEAACYQRWIDEQKKLIEPIRTKIKETLPGIDFDNQSR